MIEVTVAGGALFVEDAGDGPPVLVLHGGPGMSDYTDSMVGELAGWRALRYTQRGCPPSTGREPYSVRGHAADAVAVLDAVRVEDAIVLGHSWGAFLACALVAVAPERVRGLVLVDGLGIVGDGGYAEFDAAMTGRLTAETRAVLQAIDERSGDGDAGEVDALEAFATYWPAYFPDPGAAPPSPAGLRMSARCSADTAASLEAELERGWPASAAASYPGPVELVYGEGSPMPASSVEETAAVFADSNVVGVPGAGHFPWYEQPGCVAAALTRLSLRLPR